MCQGEGGEDFLDYQEFPGGDKIISGGGRRVRIFRIFLGSQYYISGVGVRRIFRTFRIFLDFSGGNKLYICEG